MSGEYPGEIGRDYVEAVCSFFEGNFGFSVNETPYEGIDAASVLVSEEMIRFDIIMKQERGEAVFNRVHFFYECKSRNSPEDLRSRLKDFLKKALKVMPALTRRFADNFSFLFISNIPFDVHQSDLQSIVFLRDFLDGSYDDDDLAKLARRAGILTLTDWFLETTSRGSV